jgi:hypothetical protein
MGFVDFDDVRYWDARQLGAAQREIPAPEVDGVVLPSDARFREDLLYLQSGDLQQSSEYARPCGGGGGAGADGAQVEVQAGGAAAPRRQAAQGG